jgi:hypothetical protein
MLEWIAIVGSIIVLVCTITLYTILAVWIIRSSEDNDKKRDNY